MVRMVIMNSILIFLLLVLFEFITIWFIKDLKTKYIKQISLLIIVFIGTLMFGLFKQDLFLITENEWILRLIFMTLSVIQFGILKSLAEYLTTKREK
jgi:hypothetical protein